MKDGVLYDANLIAAAPELAIEVEGWLNLMGGWHGANAAFQRGDTPEFKRLWKQYESNLEERVNGSLAALARARGEGEKP